MNKVSFDLSSKDVEALVEKLPLEDKIHLARMLSLETWQARFKNIISIIDRQLKNRRPLSDAKIVQIVKRVRKRNYAQGNH